MTSEQRLAILKRHVAELAEIYDAVQVIGSWLAEDNRTHCHKSGSGNFYARQQMCREFIEEDQTEQNASAIARKLDPPDDWRNGSTA